MYSAPSSSSGLAQAVPCVRVTSRGERCIGEADYRLATRRANNGLQHVRSQHVRHNSWEPGLISTAYGKTYLTRQSSKLIMPEKQQTNQLAQLKEYCEVWQSRKAVA